MKKQKKRPVVPILITVVMLVLVILLAFQFLRGEEAPLLQKEKIKPLEPLIREVNGVQIKEFHLTITPIAHKIAPGKVVERISFNRQIPGPEIRINEEDTVRIIVYNNHTESHAVHWHGIRTPPNMDGVAGVSQKPIQPGETFAYEFQVRQKGTFYYHDESYTQDGLYGAFIVEPARKDLHYQYVTKYFPRLMPKSFYDKEKTIFISEEGNQTLLNGKIESAPLVVTENEMINLRFINVGRVPHSMHMHGHTMLITHHDAVSLRAPQGRDTLLIGPGSRYDTFIKTVNPGISLLHDTNSKKGMIIEYR